MSWVLMAMRFPGGIRELHGLPANFKSMPIGTRAGVVQRIIELFPTTRRSRDGHRLAVEVDGCVIVMNLGPEQICRGLFFSAGGNATRAAEIVLRITQRLAVRVYDIKSGKFLDTIADLAAVSRRQ
jgi:hypothetical protein